MEGWVREEAGPGRCDVAAVAGDAGGGDSLSPIRRQLKVIRVCLVVLAEQGDGSK